MNSYIDKFKEYGYFRTGLRYFTPVLSEKKWYKRKYRIPYNIVTGKRSISNLFFKN